MKFEFDQKAIDQAVNAAAESLRGDLQRALDDIHAQYKGQPAGVVKPVLHARLTQVPGVSPDEQMVSEYVEHISAGNRIQLSYQP